MHLDIPTLLFAEAFTSVVSVVMIAAGCPRGRIARGCIWWVLGGLLTACALSLILATGETRFTLAAANLLFALSPAAYWTGARVFAGRPVSYPLMLAGFVIVAFIGFAPWFESMVSLQLGVSFAITAIYMFAGAIELAYSDTKVRARWVLAGLLVVHGMLFVAGSAEAVNGTIAVLELPALDTWFGLIHFESMVFAMGVAVFVIAFLREQSEAQQRSVAEVDALTSVSTRRAFFGAMTEALERSRGGDLPVSIVAFDLDYFKSINDTHGHGVGDKVLKLFADTVRASLRRGDWIGRIGGEEFAMLLPQTGLASAIEVAERVRATFEAAARDLEGVPLGATVSAGVAASSAGSTVQSLLIAADEGLYVAKAKGRNRVETAPPRSRGGPTTLRVA